MKTILSCLLFSGMLLFMPLTAIAASGWTEYVPVAELTPTIHGRFLVKLKNSKNPSGCKNEEIFYRDYDAGSEHIFRVILEAVTSGKKIRVYVNGKCELNGYSEVTSVSIVP